MNKWSKDKWDAFETVELKKKKFDDYIAARDGFGKPAKSHDGWINQLVGDTSSMQQQMTTTINNLISQVYSTTGTTIFANFPTTYSNITSSSTTAYYPAQQVQYVDRLPAVLDRSIKLPDGARIEFDGKHNYKLIDKDAKITYKGNPLREFNTYINASDRLEEFIRYVQDLGGVSKEDFLNLPIELFIKWLIIRAAEVDGDVLPDDQKVLSLPAPGGRVQTIPALPFRPRCSYCQRYIAKAKASRGLLVCSTDHYARLEQREAA